MPRRACRAGGQRGRAVAQHPRNDDQDGALFLAECRPSPAVCKAQLKGGKPTIHAGNGGLSWGYGWRTSRGPVRARLAFQPCARSQQQAQTSSQCLPGGPCSCPRTMLPGGCGPRRVSPGRRRGPRSAFTVPPLRRPNPPAGQGLRCSAHTAAGTTPTGSRARCSTPPDAPRGPVCPRPPPGRSHISTMTR